MDLDSPVLCLELLGVVHGVIDKGKASGLSAAKVGAESEGKDAVGSALVHLGELFADVGLGHGSPGEGKEEVRVSIIRRPSRRYSPTDRESRTLAIKTSTSITCFLPVGVEHVDHHLPPGQQAVGHVLARPHGHGALGLERERVKHN